MKKSLAILALGAVAALSLSQGCTTPQAADVPVPGSVVELKTYSVPHGYENEVRTMLQNALGGDENEAGRVEMGPSGKLVVLARPGIQAGVEAFIRELEDMETAPAPVPVTLNYWIVVGSPAGTVEDSGSVTRHAMSGYDVLGPDDLSDVALALAEIAGSVGPIEFSLVERLRLSSMGGDRAQVRGRRVQIGQYATTLSGHIVADLEILIRGFQLSTQVKLKPDQFVVLGQTGYDGDAVAWLQHVDPVAQTLYYVIEAKLE